MTNHYKNHRESLSALAYTAMIERGLKPDFGAQGLEQLKQIEKNKAENFSQKSGGHEALSEDVQDQTDLLWCSIKTVHWW